VHAKFDVITGMSYLLDTMFPSYRARAGRQAGAVKVVQAYQFALDPTPAQERMLRSHAGAARFAWNWGLAKCQERHAAEGKWHSAAELHKLWNAEKKAGPGLAWWAENSKCAYQEAFRNPDRALRDSATVWGGQGKRLRSGSKTRPHGRARCAETGTRHR
jgi:putative transposase